MVYVKLLNLHEDSAHPMSGVERLIDYVNNPEKTNAGEWVFSFSCGVSSATLDFELTRRFGERLHNPAKYNRGKRQHQAYHLIQSFDPKHEPLTPEEAHQMGRRLLSVGNSWVGYTP